MVAAPADHASICVLAVTTCNALLPPASLAALVYISAGGALYITGFRFLARPQQRFHNAIWHGFVIIGASCHYEALLT